MLSCLGEVHVKRSHISSSATRQSSCKKDGGVGLALIVGACAMTTKMFDNQICNFKILLSWRFPRKAAFRTIFLSAPKPPTPLKNRKFYFYCRLAVSEIGSSQTWLFQTCLFAIFRQKRAFSTLLRPLWGTSKQHMKLQQPRNYDFRVSQFDPPRSQSGNDRETTTSPTGHHREANVALSTTAKLQQLRVNSREMTTFAES